MSFNPILPFVSLSGSKLLIVGGSSSDARQVEVIDLENPELTCESVPHFPYPVAGATGQLYDGEKPIICGGEINKWGGSLDSCDCFTLENLKWVEMAGLKSCAQFSSSAIILDQNYDEMMLVTGGLYKFSKSVFDDVNNFDGSSSSIKSFARLPNPVYKHCLMR